MASSPRDLACDDVRSRLWGRRAGACAALVASLILLVPATASAYVRARTDDTFKPLYWRDPGQVLTVANPPEETGISTNEFRTAVGAALATWSYPQVSCTATSLRIAPETSQSQVAGRDGVNRVLMRVGEWCRDPVAMKVCHDPDAVALTTIFSTATPGAASDGEIFEADIEVNAVNFFWALIPPDAPARDYLDLYDLQSVLTHETGHFIGLGHNCYVNPGSLLIDDQGKPAPDCFMPPPDVAEPLSEATMYPLTNPDDLRMRSLTADEKRAACEIYPLWAVPIDDWAGGAGCGVAPGASPSSSSRRAGALLVLLAACGAWRRRSRRR